MDRVTVVTVNHKTLRYTTLCMQSLRRYYPKVPVVLIDNGSGDRSTEYIRALSEQDPCVECILNALNLTHGPALHQGAGLARTPYLFTLDSDCEIRAGGFLERMLKLFDEDPLLYALGQKVLVNAAGVKHPSGDKSKLNFCIRPWAMLVDREKYLQLPSFKYQGSPTVANAWAALGRGWKLVDFPVGRFIRHRGRGTENLLGIRWDGKPRGRRKK